MVKIKKKRVPATTNNITKGIVNLLIADGHSASRINTTGIWDTKLQLFRKTGARTGFYDIAATIRTKFDGPHGRKIGMTLVIDTKRGRDSLSADQIAFRTEIQAAGGLTFESKDYNDFVHYYETFIKPLFT